MAFGQISDLFEIDIVTTLMQKRFALEPGCHIGNGLRRDLAAHQAVKIEHTILLKVIAAVFDKIVPLSTTWTVDGKSVEVENIAHCYPLVDSDACVFRNARI